MLTIRTQTGRTTAIYANHGLLISIKKPFLNS
jgi:hypothetical protein